MNKTGHDQLITCHGNIFTGHKNFVTGHENYVTGHNNTITGHKTADQSWSWTGHDQLVISFTRLDTTNSCIYICICHIKNTQQTPLPYFLVAYLLLP